MILSRIYATLWKTSMFLVILPQLSRGLLSEFKICGDSECESLMSRVQAVRDHRGRDCRFLSFQQGETIFVYHKLTGKRSNLWAGSINKKFGYFPKEAVKEEQKFARKEIVVPTQESDFLCVDDFGYPIDSSHLETDDDVNGDDSDLSQLEDIEMSQRSNYTNEENAETSSKSKDTTTESDTSEEELENPETAVDVQEKGGSPPSSWLSSPVTGWLGLGQQEEPDNSAESKKKHLMREEESLTSSVPGWLGLRSEGKSDNANHGQQDRETIKSLPSTMTGWLGFGGEEKAEFSAEKVHDGAREIDIETAPEDNFRSRKMYLETQKVTSWLGNGLSKTLGFDLSEQDNGETIQVSREEGEKDEKETAFRSWFDLGIRNILAFKKDNSETGGIASDTEPEDVVRGHVNSDDNNIEDSTTNTKDSELDSTSQHDQDVNPLENQKVVIDLVQDAKDGENKFDHLGSKNDVTPLTVFTDMKSRSMQQSMSKIEDSQKDQLDIRDEAEFTNQVQNTDNSNISFVYGASDEKHKVLRRDEEILKLEASVDQSKVQESGSANEKQEEVNDKEQNKDIDEQKYLDDNQKNIEEILPNRLHETIQDEFNESATHENWKVSDANKDEENNHLELNVDYLIMRDKEFTDENLSGKDTEKHSSHWSTPTENGKEMETQDLQGTEVSFVSSLAPKADEKESIDEKRDVLSEEEKQKEMKLTEEQEFSQLLVEKQKETVERKEDMQKDFTPSEKEEPLEELQVKPLEDLTDMEQLHFKKNGELLEEGKQGNVAALKEVRRSVNMKKHAVEDELIKEIEEKKQEMLITSIEEIEEKNHVKLGSFIEKGNVEDFEDEKEESIESGEGKKHEVVEPLIETKQEVVEQNIAEFIYRQVGKLDDKNYELNGELVKELGDRQEESRERFEKKDELDGESEEELENKWQEEFKDRERDNVENLEKYDANGELADKLEEKYEVFGESIETFEKKRQGALKDEEQDRLVKLEKYEVQGESVEKLENEEYVELKVKKQEDEGKLEEKGYMLSCELQEKRQEELEDRGQKVEEKKHTLDCEMEDKIQEDLEQTLEDKYEVDRESVAKFENKKQEQFKENEREDVQTLEKYEADDEPVEKIEKKETLEETKVKLQEEMKLLDETYEVIGQSVGMFEDKSKEDPEHKEHEKSNEFELDKYEDLNKIVLQEEVDENRNGGARNWKHVLELEEDGTWDGFVQANEEVKQEFNRDVKVSVDTQKIGDPSARWNVKEKMKSFECMDDLCARMDQNQILREREVNNFISDNLAQPDILLADGPLENPKIFSDDIDQTGKTEFTENVLHLNEKDDGVPQKSSFETPKIPVSSNGINTGSESEFKNDVQIGENSEITAESGGVFGLFKEVMNSFYQSPIMGKKELTESPSEFDENLNEILKPQPVHTTEKQVDYTANNKEFQTNLQPPTTQNSQDHMGKEETTILEALAQPNAYLQDQATTLMTPRVMVEKQKEGRSEEMSLLEKVSHSQTVPSQLLEGTMVQIQHLINGIKEHSSFHTEKDFPKWFKMQVVSSLPDDMRPGPDLYGIPWEPIVISSLVGLVTVFLFSCRFYRSVKSRMYQRKEWWMAEKVAQLLEEKCEVLETLGKCQQEYDELENSLKDGGVLAQTHKTRDLEVRAQQLDIDKTQLEKTLLELKDQLDQQKAHRIEQEQKITLLEQSMEKTEEETKELQSQEEQAQTTIKVYNMNCERLQKNLETSSEENTLLKESNTQLRQQVEGWAERVSELEEEIRRYELAHNGMMQDVANKDERIMSLTDRLLGMKAWDADLEGDRSVTSKGTTGKERNGKVDATKSEVHLQKVQKLIYAAKLNADLKSVDEDKDRVFAKLNDEVKAKEDLEVSIKELENEQSSMQAETEHYSEQVQRLQQKLQIMTEMYQENELKLHRLLTVEEKERLQKEDKLNKADKNIALAMEELNNYKLRAGEMEEELEKTKQSYQTQISAHEKKAHNNWLAARAADRELSDIKRENSLLRQKITDTQFKLDALDKDPFALDSLARPLPFRAERLPYGPSPLGRPASENRALLSPPTLVEGALNRLSPRVTRGPDTGVQGEMERFGGPHSDSGSISPSWEKDRRGPPPGPPGPFPPPGYVFPEPGGPIYRRPGPPPGVMGPLPPPGPPFPHPRSLPILGPSGPVYPADTSDGISRENSLGPEHNHREPGPGDRRTPPESVLRMGVAPPLGPSMGPLDGPFPRRAPFEPPDFFPPRGPGGPPMMPMWAPRPGMMFPPRYPHGGPLQPHPLAYGPPMRPPPTDGLPPLSTVPPISQQNLSSVPHSQSLDDQTSPP
ncbi:cTAGE family member 5 isoform X2 [Corythoichthys intestinalis]|uniref:cTAGE family member 5 isoform X2 n=1 Tax=Corythoichthys intestinalis TaxID=161448 RepID=UPI0025A5A8C1|nr:melanoma inhibitory activity protein 2 isoform X2 [Corythoichthys intestinalis]